jgi:hypothetical protein
VVQWLMVQWLVVQWLVVRVGVGVSVRCREFIIMINSKCAANLS